MIGLSSYARVMESVMNSAEEQHPSFPKANSWSNKKEPSKNEKPCVGGFVLVHAGRCTHCNLPAELIAY